MSDSSSSDEEASRFREVCDPTLWRTAVQGATKNETCRAEASDEKPQRPSQGDQRQAFMLLEKIRTTLAEAHGKAGCVGLRQKDGHGPGTQGKASSGRAEASTARVAMAAPSTLSPFLAKQLTSRLDGSVKYQGGQEHRLTKDGSGDCGGGQPLHHPLRLLTNLPLAPQGSTDPTHAAARRSRPDRIPKRLSYFDGCDAVSHGLCLWVFPWVVL
ncbi:uncharacterized protein LOC126990805 [Eriocheir sinensis]|uniref:uncharacterized protein LOC126990805 n=2 Tax=Eriocheir sinensis TaxID=95602 RepID=UPI0021C72F1C|nr:uncharacterized protein LOC126990805 [Eriocheir sinensis]